MYNILSEFVISTKLRRLIKMCLNEMYSRVRLGKHLSDMNEQNANFDATIQVFISLIVLFLLYLFRVSHPPIIRSFKMHKQILYNSRLCNIGILFINL